MSLSNGGLHIRMTQQLLYGADILTRLQQVGGERMAQRMWSDTGGDSCILSCFADRTLDVFRDNRVSSANRFFL